MNFSGILINNKYIVKEKIGEGGMSTVYRAIENNNENINYAIKFLKKEHLSSRIEDNIRFNKEATTVTRLNHTAILTIHEIGEYESFPYIVMDYINGKNMSHFIQSKDFDINLFVDIIIQISSALDYIHSNGIVHRDLKPSNIMIVENNGYSVKLIDFGLAEVKEFTRISDAKDVAGTFSYMSPEQCGALKRKVDERSDLYSLGIVFYQLITRQLPFSGEDVSSIIHQHIAKQPVSPLKYNPEMPQIIEKIILKLIEKEPEKRYQSAQGLIKDLIKFKEKRKDFPLGTEDGNVKISYITNLVGREKELHTIKSFMDTAKKGKGNVCFIKGETGLGKTRFLEEIKNYAITKGASVLSSGFISGINKTPLSVFKEAVNSYINRLNSQTDFIRERKINSIKATTGELGQILIKTFPYLKEILGECPPLIELESDKDYQRFLTVLSSFFLNIGKIENFLVLLIDDLQWADNDTLDIIETIAKYISLFPVVIVGTYRENENQSEASIDNYYQRLKNSEIHAELIELGNLDEKLTHLLISRLLYDELENTETISNMIYSKSNGNLQFTIEMLKQLVEEKALYYENRKWQVDKRIISQLNVPASVYAILLKKIITLNIQEKETLSYAAIFNTTIDIELLIKISGLAAEETIKNIDHAVLLQIIEPIESKKGLFRFSHPGLKDEFLNFLPEETQKRLHLQIADFYEIEFGKKKENILVELVYHFTKAENMQKTLHYIIPAAEKAEEEFAKDTAAGFYQQAISLLEQDDKKGSSKWIFCMKRIGNCYLSIGNFIGAIETGKSLIEFLKSKKEKAITYQRICLAYFKKGDFQECEKYGRYALNTLGERHPLSKTGTIISFINEIIIHIFRRIFARKYCKKPKKHSKYSIIIDIYVSLYIAYILWDMKKAGRIMMRILNLSEKKLGKSRELGYALVTYSVVVLSIPFFNLALKSLNQGIHLIEESGYTWGIAQSSFCQSLYHQWKGEYDKSIEFGNKSISLFRQIGDVSETASPIALMYHNYFYTGNYIKARETAEEYYNMSRINNDFYGVAAAAYSLFRVSFEEGDIETALVQAQQAIEYSEKAKTAFIKCVTLADMGIIYLEKGENNKAMDLLLQAYHIMNSNSFMKQYVVYIPSYLSLAFLSLYKESKKKNYLNSAKKYSKIAFHSTKKWVTHFPLALFARALIDAETGKDRQANQLFTESVTQLKKLNKKYELIKVLYHYGLYLKKSGDDNTGISRLYNAYEIAKEIGAKHLRKNLAAQLNIIDDSQTSSTSVQRLADRQRLTGLIKVSQDISSILNVDVLIENVLSKAVSVIGAQRGYLFLVDEHTNKLNLKAMRSIVEHDKTRFSQHIVDNVFLSGKPALTSNAADEKEFSVYESVIVQNIKSVVCIPLKYHDKTIGVCYLDNNLSSGVFSIEDLEILTVLMNQSAIAIENASLYQNLEQKVEERTNELNKAYNELKKTHAALVEKDKIISEDLSMAKRIQESLITGAVNFENSIRIAVHFQPMIEVGGDIYDVFELKPGYYRIFIADAIGHGIQAALTTMIIKSEYDKIKLIDTEPNIIINLFNKTFIDSYSKLNAFFTCFILDIDTLAEKIIFASAGHPDQFLFSNGKLETLRAGGKMLGIIPEMQYEYKEFPFNRGSRIILFTDGLFEVFNDEQMELGEDQLGDLIIMHSQKSADTLIKNLITEISKWRENQPVNDDITAIVIDFTSV